MIKMLCKVIATTFVFFFGKKRNLKRWTLRHRQFKKEMKLIDGAITLRASIIWEKEGHTFTSVLNF